MATARNGCGWSRNGEAETRHAAEKQDGEMSCRGIDGHGIPVQWHGVAQGGGAEAENRMTQQREVKVKKWKREGSRSH